MEPHDRQAQYMASLSQGHDIPAYWNENKKGTLLLVPRLTGVNIQKLK